MSDVDVQHIRFRSYAGPRVRGTVVIPPPTGERAAYHVDRAYWLTCKVESGAKFGAVVAYDGTGVTAGPDQHIAVYPKELAHEDYNAADDQGGFWELLRRLESVRGGEEFEAATEAVFAGLRARGWYLSQDGRLRHLNDGSVTVGTRELAVRAGDLVHGALIRDELTPVGGLVPSSGPRWAQARAWAKRFHELFAHPDGHRAQLEFGKEHLVERTRRRGLGAYRAVEITALRIGTNWTSDVDLALCMYQSNSVNAPAIANRILGQTNPDSMYFARELIRKLGTSKFGKWDDDIPAGRYQRTRKAALESGLWPADFFHGSQAIMPQDLPG